MSVKNLQQKICLVTGGAGFIGSHLVGHLLKEGYAVRIYDNLSTGKLENIQPFLKQGVEFIQGDICNLEKLKSACRGVYAIFHEAAIASVFFSIQEPCLTHEVNVTGTLNVLEAARQEGVKRVLMASSAAVYGLNELLPKSETMTPLPVSPYGYHKWMLEQYAHLYSELYELQVTCFRYFNVFGPRQDPKSPYSGVISIFIDSILSGQDPTIYGDGHQSRDFVSVTDICHANILALEAEGLNSFEVFNIGSGRAYSLLELLDNIQKITGSQFHIQHREERRGDLRHSVADINLLKEKLDFITQKPFYIALEELITYSQGLSKNHYHDAIAS